MLTLRLQTMRTSLGILAHNEEARLPALLAALWRQTWLQASAREHDPFEVLCVVNGSSDRTAAVARDYLAAHPLPGVSPKVVEIERAGKANAWNEYVHRYSAPDAGILFLVDADIDLPGTDTLALLAGALQHKPGAVAAVDQPVKDLAARGDAGARARLSRAAADLAAVGPPKLCGQLYAARAAALRKIEVPEGLLVEDGFIRAMLLTDNFRSPEDVSRIVRADGAWHVFEAETAFGTLLRHERRIVIGTLVNILLFKEFNAAAKAGHDVAAMIRARNAAAPDWVAREVGTRWRDAWGPGIREYVSLPLRQWRQGGGKPRLLPGAWARAAFNAMAAASAWRELRRGRFAW